MLLILICQVLNVTLIVIKYFTISLYELEFVHTRLGKVYKVASLECIHYMLDSSHRILNT